MVWARAIFVYRFGDEGVIKIVRGIEAIAIEIKPKEIMPVIPGGGN